MHLAVTSEAEQSREPKPNLGKNTHLCQINILVSSVLNCAQCSYETYYYTARVCPCNMILECERPSSRLSKHNKFPGTRAKVGRKKWHWGLFTGGRLVLIWQKIKAFRASLTFYPQYGSHLCRAQLILCPAHIVPLIRSAGVNNFQSVVP